MKVGIVGLGLVGGSLARDLAARGHTVVGWDRSRSAVAAARRSGMIAAVAGRNFAGFADCDVWVLAVPVTAAPAVLAAARDALAAVPLITDVGSTKRSIVRAAERLGMGARFVGSHPLAGDTRSGWRASRSELFRHAPVFLTPTRTTRVATLARARSFWRIVGAKPRVMPAAAHDRLLAGASHLPQLVSSALAVTMARAGIARTSLGPGGRDTTRLAGAAADVWIAIALDNADRIVPLLRRHERVMRQVRVALTGRGAPALRRLLADAGKWSRER